MVNRNKKKALVEWFNCLSDFPIESIPHLMDGSHFLHLIMKLKKLDSIPETDNPEERYVHVQAWIDEYFKTRSQRFIDYPACQKGVDTHLAKVGILLLSALVNMNLRANDSDIEKLKLLEPQIQSDIQECLMAVLANEDGTLAPDFDKVLSYSTPYEQMAGPSTPKVSPKSPSTPKNQNRKRGRPARISDKIIPSPADSPLKRFFESPQMLNQQIIQRMRENISDNAKKFASLEETKFEMEISLGEKDKKIKELEQKIKTLRGRRSSQRLEQKMNVEEEIPTKQAMVECSQCKDYSEDLGHLRNDRDQCCSELKQKETEVNQLKLRLDSITLEFSNQAEEKMKLKEEVGNLQTEKLEMVEQIRNNEKYIEFYRNKIHVFSPDANQSQNMEVGEPMTVVEIEKLKEELQKQEKAYEREKANFIEYKALSKTRFQTLINEQEAALLKGKELTEKNQALEKEKADLVISKTTEVQGLNNKIAELETNCAALAVQLEKAEDTIKIKKTDCARLTAQLGEAENTIEIKKRDYQSSCAEVTAYATELDDIKKTKEELWLRVNNYCEILASKEQKIKHFEHQIEEKASELELANQKYLEQKEKNEELKRRLDIDSPTTLMRLKSEMMRNQKIYQTEMNAKNEEIVALRESNNMLQSSLEAANAKTEQSLDNMNKLDEQNTTMNEKLVSMNQKVVELEEQLNGRDQMVAKLSSDKEKSEKKTKELEDLIKRLKNDIAIITDHFKCPDAEMVDLDSSQDQQTTQLRDLTSLLNFGQNRFNELSQRCDCLTSQCEELTRQKETIEAERDEYCSQMITFQNQLEEFKEVNNDLTSENSNLNLQLSQFVDMATEVDSLKADNEKLQGEKSGYSQRIANLEADKRKTVKEHNVQVSSLLDKKREINENLNRLSANHDELTSKFFTLEEENESLLTQLNEKTAECERLTIELEGEGLLQAKQKTINTLETERDSLSEKVGDLERQLSALTKSKELADKEYYMCVLEKDKKVGELESNVSLLQEVLGQKSESLNKLQEKYNDLMKAYSDKDEKFCDLIEKVHRLEHIEEPLQEEITSLKQQKEELSSRIEDMSDEIENLQGQLSLETSSVQKVSKDHQKLKSKYERAKEIILKLENDLKAYQNELSQMARAKESWSKKLEASQEEHKAANEKLNALRNDKKQLMKELQQKQQEMPLLREKVKELNKSNDLMRKENRSLFTQLEHANRQMKEIGKDVEGSPMNRRMTLGSSMRFPASSSLTNLSDGIKKDPLRRACSSSGESYLYQRNIKTSSSNVVETYMIPETMPSVHLSSTSSLNGSITSDGIQNRSLLNEEEFFDQHSLPNLNSIVEESPSVRMKELSKRNSLCPPHLRSCYPVERNLDRYNASQIRQGLDFEKRDSHVTLNSDEPEAKRKRNYSTRESLASTEGSSRNSVTTPSKKGRVFRFPTPASVKRAMARAGIGKKPEAKEEKAKAKKGIYFVA